MKAGDVEGAGALSTDVELGAPQKNAIIRDGETPMQRHRTGEAVMANAVEAAGLSHFYQSRVALDNVSFTAPLNGATALIGPDAVGKSTLLGVIAGMKRLQRGDVRVLGSDIRDAAVRESLRHRVAYMPQGLGRSLYPTLSILENIDFMGRLFGLRRREREHRIDRLLRATGLYSFRDRAAAQLSGGMKQKLQLCCALIHQPELLILDEPTTGVDPLSRRQFWSLVEELRKEGGEMSLVVATAYMEEAARFDHLVAMHAGQVLIADSLPKILERTGCATLEEAYVSLLPDARREEEPGVQILPFVASVEPPAMEARNLTRRFGDFVAVDDVSFTIRRGEIFGFLGSNGCGKTTTMKMLTGLLEVTSGNAKMFGEAVRAGDMRTRSRIGYMSQNFSLYEELTVRQNLALHARIYCFGEDGEIDRLVVDAMDEFSLAEYGDALPAGLPLGIRQRLQLAAACIHTPDVLILDEPTSGVDPLTRDRFWRHLLRLSREKRVTIFVSTHFMREAARCDRISLMHHGRLLAVGTPAELMRLNQATNLDDVFVKYLLEFEAVHAIDEPALATAEGEPEGWAVSDRTLRSHAILDMFTRLWTFARREAIEILHDRARLTFTALGPIIFLCVAAYSVSFDIRKAHYAVIDRDHSQLSRRLIEEFSASPEFERVVHDPLGTDEISDSRAQFLLEIPSGFGRDLVSGHAPEVAVVVDGSQPLFAQNLRAYVTALVTSFAAPLSAAAGMALTAPILVEVRFLYNQQLESIYTITPGVIMLGLTLFPTMMAALGIVREREVGSLVNLYLSPARTIELIVGKQITYAAFSMVAFLGMLLVSVSMIEVPLNGSLAALCLGAALYILASAAFGLLVSASVASQVAALFGTAITCLIAGMTYSGLLFPVSSMDGANYIIAHVLPCSWFQQIILGAFAKGLSFSDFGLPYAALTASGIVYLFATWLMLGKQEK